MSGPGQGQQLALTGGAMHAQTVSEALTADLEAALLKASTTEEATRAVLAKPEWVSLLKENSALIRRLAGESTSEQIWRAYQPLLLIFDPKDFGNGKEGEDLQAAWFEVHVQVMKKYPLEAIEIAVAEWLGPKGKAWMPKPSELAKLAEEASFEIKLIAYRVRRAVDAAASYAPPRERSPEDRAQVKRMLDDMRGPDGKIQLVRRVDHPTPIGDQHRVAANLRRLGMRPAV